MRVRSGEGTRGCYDFGEAGYMDNLRRRSERKPATTDLVMIAGRQRRCTRCNTHRPMRGGTLIGGFSGRFVCAGCR